MNDFYALIRYGLPGSLLLFTAVLPDLLSYALNTAHKSYMLSSALGTSLSWVNGLGAAMALAVVPLGYLVYQVYFAFYWVLPEHPLIRRRFPKWAKRPWTQIPFKTVYGTQLAKEIRNHRSFHHQWFIVESGWYDLLTRKSNKDGSQLLSNRASRLFDIYHSLGAATAAIIIGAFSVGLSSLWYILPGSSLEPLLLQWRIAVPFLLFVVGACLCIGETRYYTRRNVIKFQNGVIRFLEKRPDMP